MSVRVAEFAAIVLIGDGVVGAVFPRRHTVRWLRGPAPWRRTMRAFAKHPGLTRAAALAEIVAGMSWAARLPARPS